MSSAVRLGAAFAVAIAAVALIPAPAAHARPARRCNSADLRFAFMPGLANDFGVFRLRISGGRCATAHRVAKAWKRRFEARERAGRIAPPRRVKGFRFTTLPAREAQTFRERGRRRHTTIRFVYRVPNG